MNRQTILIAVAVGCAAFLLGYYQGANKMPGTGGTTGGGTAPASGGSTAGGTMGWLNWQAG
jgi:hypothetical protein